MPYFALLYETVDDFIAHRAVHRDEHLRSARATLTRASSYLGHFSKHVQ